jgi:hypothetical protein
VPAGGSGFTVSVDAGGVVARVSDAGTDFVVSRDANDLIWIVMLQGSGEISRPVARAGVAGGAEAIAEGQAVAIALGGASGQPVSVDLAAVNRWFMGRASGAEVKPLHETAFRCTVEEAEVELAYDPVADGGELDVLETLQRDALVDALALESNGEWLRVVAVASGTEGWVRAAAVGCVGPTTLLASEEALVAAVAPAPVAAVAQQPIAPAGQPTPSPSPSPMPTADAAASGSTGDGEAREEVPPTEEPPTPTPCDTECVVEGPPTETPRPPRPTREPTEPPAATDPPPPEPTEPPAPEPTNEPPPEATDEP